MGELEKIPGDAGAPAKAALLTGVWLQGERDTSDDAGCLYHPAQLMFLQCLGAAEPGSRGAWRGGQFRHLWAGAAAGQHAHRCCLAWADAGEVAVGHLPKQPLCLPDAPGQVLSVCCHVPGHKRFVLGPQHGADPPSLLGFLVWVWRFPTLHVDIL